MQTATTAELFRDDAYLASAKATVIAVAPDGIVLDRTPFYPLGGGQPGDSGMLTTEDGGTVRIVDTRKGEGGAILHLVADDAATLLPGATVTASIDWPRRHSHMRMHTALHLLCAVIPQRVTGGALDATRGRLDFDVATAALDKDAIAEALNAFVAAGHPVGTQWLSEEEFAARPDLVRTLAVAPPRVGRVRLVEIAGVDLQACGGTHVANTAEIGQLAVLKIENKGRQNRRVVIGFARHTY